MTGYNFTARVRRALALSRELAAQRFHNYVGTEHFLLGLIAEGEGEGAGVAMLAALDVDLKDLRRRIDEQTAIGRYTDAGPDLPYTSRAKKVLELAMLESREHNHSYVGTEHFLIGLAREEKGIAAQALQNAGATTQKLRGAMLLVHRSIAGGSSTDRPSRESPPQPVVARLAIEVRHTNGRIEKQEFTNVLSAMRFLANLELTLFA